MLREVEVELAGLRERQRRLMIAIGQKVEASAPNIPDGPAHYAAVQRLRSALEGAERELLGMEGVSRVPGRKVQHRRLNSSQPFQDAAYRGRGVIDRDSGSVRRLVALWGLFGLGYQVDYKVVSDGT